MHLSGINSSVQSKKLSKRKKFFFAIFTISLGLFLIAVSIECAYRLYKYRNPDGTNSQIKMDPVLGWALKPGKYAAGWLDSQAGTDKKWSEGVDPFYLVNDKGFRRWDDDRSGPVVLIIGDSFTEAGYAGSGGTYYDRIAKELNCRFYVSGCRGYGTFQETLVLEKYIKTIRPGIVMLQMCDNDLYNNDPLFNQMNINWDPGEAVPYLYDDAEVRLEKVRYRGIVRGLMQKSMFLPYALRRFKLIPSARSFEYKDSPAFDGAVKRTGEILKRFRNSCGKETTVLAYLECGQPDPDLAESVFRGLCDNAGITYMDNVSGALRLEESKAGNAELGRHDGPGGHYNLFGHYVIGKALEPHLRQALERLPSKTMKNQE